MIEVLLQASSVGLVSTFEHTSLVLVWVLFLKETYTRLVLVLGTFKKLS
jgi:hypothetical protein